MLEITKTDVYERWFRKLRDARAKARITARLRRVEVTGNFGDSKGVGGSVSELRIDYGPGYRVYYTLRNDVVVLLLVGGDKSSQESDIKRAIRLAQELEEQSHG